MPDEPVWGQFHRMARVNGLHRPEALEKLVPTKKQTFDRRWLTLEREVTYILAGTRRISGLYDYFRAHGVIPQFLSINYWLNNWLSLLFRWGLHHAVLYPSRVSIRSCSECASEDVEQFGFAWFRRGHQLPGVEWCLQHSCPLSQMSTGPNLFRGVDWLSFQVLSTRPPHSQPIPPFVHRYLRVLEWLRNFPSGRGWLEFARTMNFAAFGLDEFNGAAVGFREMVRSEAPTGWFQSHFVEPKPIRSRVFDCADSWQSPALALRAIPFKVFEFRQTILIDLTRKAAECGTKYWSASSAMRR
jgi:hypothetical protein